MFLGISGVSASRCSVVSLRTSHQLGDARGERQRCAAVASCHGRLAPRADCVHEVSQLEAQRLVANDVDTPTLNHRPAVIPAFDVDQATPSFNTLMTR